MWGAGPIPTQHLAGFNTELKAEFPALWRACEGSQMELGHHSTQIAELEGVAKLMQDVCKGMRNRERERDSQIQQVSVRLEMLGASRPEAGEGVKVDQRQVTHAATGMVLLKLEQIFGSRLAHLEKLIHEGRDLESPVTRGELVMRNQVSGDQSVAEHLRVSDQ